MALDPKLRTYDPKLVALSFKGAIVTGYTDGDFIAVTNDDGFESRTGADGSEDRVNKNITGVNVDVTLMGSSITNDVFNVFYEIDKATNLGYGAFSIKDLNGTMLLTSGEAYITKKADKSLGNGVGSVTWTFRCPQAIYNPGSNL